jgi:para-aminobenzoate synthetase component 1
LVRNDLTKTAVTGSIKVEELFGIYSFPQLHQMISTVTSIQDEQYDVTAVIKNAFPMGSMTGAPKVRAMELIEQLEVFKRAAYSGALGYIMPDGTFDFNVLIRSIFIDQQENKLTFNVGSAITLDSNPEEEYEECLLKAKAIFKVLGSE